jgi:Uma2 family endonuclease
MNERFALIAPPEPPATQAAEGLRRRVFTVAEIEAMVAAGIIAEDERFELIGGEAVPMSPKGLRHERLKTWLMMQLARKLPATIAFTPETTFRLSPDTFLEPDFVLYDAATGLEGLNGATCLLAIEIADTSLDYDRGRKALIYAAFGIGELWVIDAVTRITTIHREPTPTGYRQVVDVRPEDALTALAVPGLGLRLSDFA